MNFLNDLSIPSDLLNVANDLSNQISQNGLNGLPCVQDPQQFMNEINNISQNAQSGFEMLNKLQELYKTVDQDGDGAITQGDFTILLEKLGLGFAGKHVAKILFKKIDTNKNGKVDLQEASSLVKVIMKLFEDLTKRQATP